MLHTCFFLRSLLLGFRFLRKQQRELEFQLPRGRGNCIGALDVVVSLNAGVHGLRASRKMRAMPPPKGTSHTVPLDAFQFVVMIGCDFLRGGVALTEAVFASARKGGKTEVIRPEPKKRRRGLCKYRPLCFYRFAARFLRFLQQLPALANPALSSRVSSH